MKVDFLVRRNEDDAWVPLQVTSTTEEARVHRRDIESFYDRDQADELIVTVPYLTGGKHNVDDDTLRKIVLDKVYAAEGFQIDS